MVHLIYAIHVFHFRPYANKYTNNMGLLLSPFFFPVYMKRMVIYVIYVCGSVCKKKRKKNTSYMTMVCVYVEIVKWIEQPFFPFFWFLLLFTYKSYGFKEWIHRSMYTCKCVRMCVCVFVSVDKHSEIRFDRIKMCYVG